MAYIYETELVIKPSSLKLAYLFLLNLIFKKTTTIILSNPHLEEWLGLTNCPRYIYGWVPGQKYPKTN